MNSSPRNKSKNPASNPECYRCGEPHEASTCRFKDAQCFNCGIRGHLAKACRNKSSGKSNKGTESWRRETKQPGKRDGKNSERKKEQPTHLVEETTKEYDVYAESMYHVRGENRLKAYEVSIELCNEPCKFEIDTGATRSILSEEPTTSCVTNWN